MNRKITTEENFLIFNETKGAPQNTGVPFVIYKNKILGKKYQLNLIFVNDKKIHQLNKTYRKVNKPTDILSFPIDKESGEIFICEKIAKNKAKDFDLPAQAGREYNNFISFLFIHGCVHLLGYDHGDKMEAVEIKFRKLFKI